MLDFTGSVAPLMYEAKVIEQEIEARRMVLQRRVRELRPAGERRSGSERERRHELFVEGLDAAQREGITVDAWFAFKFADPELSARAEWAGLNEPSRRESHA